MASMSSSSGAVTSGILDGKVPVFVFPVQVRLSITSRGSRTFLRLRKTVTFTQ